MYNLLQYSKNYSKTFASLWNYYRDELTDDTNDDHGPNKNLINSKSFKYKARITGSTYNVAANNPNYDANNKLNWSAACVITSMEKNKNNYK